MNFMKIFSKKMTKVSVKDKVEAVLMYEKGETLKVVAKRFKTSIPLVHYWKKNKDKLLKELDWSVPNNSNSKLCDNSQFVIKEELATPASVTSQTEDNQNVFLENKHFDSVSDQDEVENNVINSFNSTSRNLPLPLNNVQNNMNLVSTNTRDVQNNFINHFSTAQQKFSPLFNLQTQLNLSNQFSNSRRESTQPRKSCKINQTRQFVSGLTKVQQLQLQEYHSLKNVYDTQMEAGEKLKQRELRVGNNSSNNSLVEEIEEYNKVINSELFIKIIERLEYLETALFSQI